MKKLRIILFASVFFLLGRPVYAVGDFLAHSSLIGRLVPSGGEAVENLLSLFQLVYMNGMLGSGADRPDVKDKKSSVSFDKYALTLDENVYDIIQKHSNNAYKAVPELREYVKLHMLTIPMSNVDDQETAFSAVQERLSLIAVEGIQIARNAAALANNAVGESKAQLSSYVGADDLHETIAQEIAYDIQIMKKEISINQLRGLLLFMKATEMAAKSQALYSQEKAAETAGATK